MSKTRGKDIVILGLIALYGAGIISDSNDKKTYDNPVSFALNTPVHGLAAIIESLGGNSQVSAAGNAENPRAIDKALLSTDGSPIVPTQGTITTRYHQIITSRASAVPYAHEGIDIGPPDQFNDYNVFAATAGKILKADYDPIYFGNEVEIQDADGNIWLYGHMQNNSLRVQVGQTIDQGTILGIVGATGNANGRHLHLELHNNGIPINPAEKIPTLNGPVGTSVSPPQKIAH